MKAKNNSNIGKILPTVACDMLEGLLMDQGTEVVGHLSIQTTTSELQLLGEQNSSMGFDQMGLAIVQRE